MRTRRSQHLRLSEAAQFRAFSDEGEGVSNEGEAESAPPVERSRTVPSFSEVKNTQRGVAEGVSDEG
jgi:hypothetical protein